jgi:hypothetical protein
MTARLQRKSSEKEVGIDLELAREASPMTAFGAQDRRLLQTEEALRSTAQPAVFLLCLRSSCFAAIR